MKVSYVKFYQAVQIGKELLTHVTPTKPLNTKITWEAGLLKIERPGINTVYVPTANIMFFHELTEKTEETEEKKAKKTKAA